MCEGCPIKTQCPDKVCVAEKFNAPNLCEHVDPASPKYHTGYVTIIADKSCGTNNYVPTGRSGSDNFSFSEAKAQPELPSLWKQAKNFAGAMVDHAKDGFKNVDEEEAGRRLSICETCEYFRSEDYRCSHPDCGCFMRAKVKLRSSICPIGRW